MCIQRFPSSWLGKDCGDIQSEYLHEFRMMEEAVTVSELGEMRQSLDILETIAEDMEHTLEDMKKRSDGQSRDAGGTRISMWSGSPVNQLSNLQRVRLICFFECSESEWDVQDGNWRDALRTKWTDFFPDVPFGPQEERWLSRVLVLRLPGQSDRSRPEDKSEFSRYCRAMGAALVHGGVKNLESAVFLNSILLTRAVMMTMTYANPDKLVSRTEDALLADALSYLENVTYIASNEENNIILEFIRLFRPNRLMDRECVLFAQKYRSVLSRNFSAICKAMEQKNRNIHQVTNLSERVKKMEGSLRNADFTVKRDIVLGLDRGSYGHRLGELYRYAEGLDERDTGQVRELLGCILQLLDTLGITPVSQDRLDECICKEDVLYDRIAPEGNLTREGV